MAELSSQFTANVGNTEMTFYDLVTALIHFLGAPAWAGTVLFLFHKLGAWLDQEADPTWASDTATALKQATWVGPTITFMNSLNLLFDKLFGTRHILGWLAIKRSIQVSIIATALLLIVVWIPTFLTTIPYDARNLGTTRMTTLPIEYGTVFRAYLVRDVLTFMVVRFVFGLLFDFMSLVRVRYFVKIITASGKLHSAVLMVLLDFVFAIGFIVIVSVLLEDIVYNYSGLKYYQVPDIDRFYRMGKLMIEGVFLHPQSSEAVYLYVSLTPSILLYFYCLAFFAVKAFTKLAPAIIFVSRRFRFTEPFTFIGNIAGFLAGVSCLVVYFIV
jgi:hypothetical protein